MVQRAQLKCYLRRLPVYMSTLRCRSPAAKRLSQLYVKFVDISSSYVPYHSAQMLYRQRWHLCQALRTTYLRAQRFYLRLLKIKGSISQQCCNSGRLWRAQTFYISNYSKHKSSISSQCSSAGLCVACTKVLCAYFCQNSQIL